MIFTLCLFATGSIAAIASTITAISASAAAFVAFRGLATWKKQLKGQTEYELARRYLKNALKVREAIRIARNPWISNDEKKNADKELDIEHDIKNSDASVYQIRMKRIDEIMADMEADSIEAEVIWGVPAIKITDLIKKCVNELNITLMKYFNEHVWNNIPYEEKERLTQIIYRDGDSIHDDFANKVNDAVIVIKDYLKPHLKS